MPNRSWIPGIALALIGCLLLPTVWPLLPIRILAAAMIVVGAGAAALFHGKKRDRYDLGKLRDVHDRAIVQRLLEEEQPPDDDTILCRSCGACYPAVLGVCPECGHLAGR